MFFKQEGVTCEAEPGELIWEVAERCGVEIPTGCHAGNCGLCEMEIVKISSSDAASGAPRPTGSVVRTCIAKVPPGYARLEVEAMADDAIWGVDGFDT